MRIAIDCWLVISAPVLRSLDLPLGVDIAGQLDNFLGFGIAVTRPLSLLFVFAPFLLGRAKFTPG